MTCNQIIDSPFLIVQLILSSQLDWMDRWMCLIIFISIPRSLPLFSRNHMIHKVAPAISILKTFNNLLKINSLIILCRFSPGIAQKPLVVQFLHNGHTLRRTYLQFFRNQLLCLNSVQWLRPVLLRLLSFHFYDSGVFCLNTTIVNLLNLCFNKQMITSPLRLTAQFLTVCFSL